MEELDAQPAAGLPEFLRDPLGALRRRWPWMLAVFVLGAIGTVAYVSTVPVRYMATASILVSSQQIPKEFVRSTVPDAPFDRINAMVGEILSRERLSQLVEEHGLYHAVRREGDMMAAVAAMRGDVKIGAEGGLGPRTRDTTSSIYTISFRHEDPKVAAVVANDLASLFTAASSRMRGQQARLTTEFLQRELERTEAQLREQDRQITEFKERHRGELPSELNSNLSKLERLQQQRQTLAQQLADAETRLAMLGTTGDIANPSSPAARLAALQAQLDQQLAVHTEEHPNVISLKRQVARLEEEVRGDEGGGRGSGDATRPILIQSAQRSIASIQARMVEIEAELATLEESVAQTPGREEALRDLEERATVLREKYLEFLRKVEEAELAESLEAAQQGERVAVLDRALPPAQPERERLKYLAGGLLASLLAALGVGFALELWDPVMVSADQIESGFDVPVLGSAPRLS